MGNRTITTVAGVHGQRMVPEYLINFLESIYPYKRPVNYGKRLLREDLLLRAMKLYKLAGKKPKAVFGRRMIPNYLAKFLEDNHFAEIDDTDMGYIKELNSIAYPYGNVLKIGGMSYKTTNLFNYTLSETYAEISDSIITLKNGYNGWQQKTGLDILLKANTTYYFDTFPNTTPNATTTLALVSSNNDSIVEINLTSGNAVHKTYTPTENVTIAKLNFYTNAVLTSDISTKVSISTSLVSNESDFKPYFTGIRDSAVTSVVSKDSNDTTLDTLTIPDEVQALEDYGVGINENIYNYVDLVEKKYNHNAIKYNLKNIAKSSYIQETAGIPTGYNYRFNVISFIVNNIYAMNTPTEIRNNTVTQNCNVNDETTNEISFSFHGSQLYLILYTKTLSTIDALYDYLQANDTIIVFKKATPNKDNISSYITTNEIEIANGGTLTFTNTYEQAVPFEITYIVRF